MHWCEKDEIMHGLRVPSPHTQVWEFSNGFWSNYLSARHIKENVKHLFNCQGYGGSKGNLCMCIYQPKFIFCSDTYLSPPDSSIHCLLWERNKVSLSLCLNNDPSGVPRSSSRERKHLMNLHCKVRGTRQADWSDSNKTCLPVFSKSVHVRGREGKQNDARAPSMHL